MITMNCANCGATLEITEEMETFACGSCGAQQKVERKGGTVSLKMVESAIKAVQRGTDRTAAELAVQRLTQELAQLEVDRKLRLKKEKDGEKSVFSTKRTIYLFTIVTAMIILWIGLSNLFNGIILSGLIAFTAGSAILSLYPANKDTLERIAAINKEFDDKDTRLREQMAINRKILDE